MDEKGKSGNGTLTKNIRKKENGKLKGPLRLTRLCVLCIILPGILIAGPLYLRYRVYSGQVYPIGMSDMRLVDNRISTTWCQRQLVKSNATFNAYLLPNEPQMKPNPVQVSMTRQLDLQDDMKEYWGFYLLKGSSFTVSTCCRWPGAFLTVIKGHKQLRECAYFGDDSSEEEEELDKIEKEKKEEIKEEDAMSNEPWIMKKARPGVIFHGSEQNNLSKKHRLSKEILEDNNNEQLREWFPMRSQKSKMKKKIYLQNKQNPLTPVENNAKLVNSSQNIPKVSEQNNKANDTRSGQNRTHAEDMRSDELDNVYQELLKKLQKLRYQDRNSLVELKDKLKSKENDSETKNFRKRREIEWRSLHERLNLNDEDYNAAEEEGEEEEEEENLMYEDLRGTFNETTANDRSDSEFWSSFSSSEERLINCAGLIVNLPLIPKKGCQANNPEDVLAKACSVNKFTYKVPTNGYYFFVFSSENEIQPNYIRVTFQFEKILYNVSNSVVACTNTTESCSLPLNFFSWEKAVLEMPLSNNDSMWNEEFLVVSVCEPRTVVYAACVVAVPILILLFAF